MAPELQDSVADVLSQTAEALRRSTVQVRDGRHGGGSGVIWSSDGLVVTNAHVARGSSATVELWDGRTFEGEVLARDPRRDMASLRISVTGLPAAIIADSDALRVGQLAVAVGNPLGLTGALTLGIIHAIAPAEGHGQQSWVQADVHLAPGNSGGPLADGLGRVIGINSMSAGHLGLAVPSNAVQLFLRDHASRPQLGVTMQPVTVPVNGSPVPGMLVLSVVDDSPAARAGIALGDVLIGANGRQFANPRDLADALYTSGPGRVLRLDMLRGGLQRSVAVPLLSEAERGSVEEGAGVAA